MTEIMKLLKAGTIVENGIGIRFYKPEKADMPMVITNHIDYIFVKSLIKDGIITDLLAGRIYFAECRYESFGIVVLLSCQ